MKYSDEVFDDGKGRTRHGSPIFYSLLERMAELHDKKSHDYASDNKPSGNYHFAGMLSQLFKNPDDSGFVGRIGEKLYRLANLENNNKIPQNESIEDTELDICVIITLWMADRKQRRNWSNQISNKATEYVGNKSTELPKLEIREQGIWIETPEHKKRQEIIQHLYELNNDKLAKILADLRVEKSRHG